MASYPSTLPAGRSIATLFPGHLFCEREPQLVSTILGSCVAVCLWDKRLRFGGMDHHMLPTRPANAEPSLRYGDVAVPELVRRMLDHGSHLMDLQAKMFGGACVLGAPGDYAVGRRNAEVAIAELYRHGIPLVACRLSGTEGVAVLLCTGCGDVWVRLLESGVLKPPARNRVREAPWKPDQRFRPDMVARDGGPVTLRGDVTLSAVPCPVCRAVPQGRSAP